MKRIKWGVLGTAGVAKHRVIPGILKSEYGELYAIGGRSDAKVREFNNLFGPERTYLNFDELLDDPDLDAVYIPLPNPLHKEWCIRAARKKKHILCEKPLALTARDEEEVFAVCKENQVLIMEAVPYVHAAVFKRVLEIVASREIGAVNYGSTNFATMSHCPENIRMRKDTAGGVTYDMACYGIILALALYGKQPKEVHAVALFNDGGIDTSCAALLHFGEKQTACCVSGMVLSEKQVHTDFSIFGENGSISVLDKAFNEQGTCVLRVKTAKGERQEDLMVADNYKLEIDNFCRAILYGDELGFSQEFSLNTAEVLDKILKGIGYGQDLEGKTASAAVGKAQKWKN